MGGWVSRVSGEVCNCEKSIIMIASRGEREKDLDFEAGSVESKERNPDTIPFSLCLALLCFALVFVLYCHAKVTGYNLKACFVC